MNRNPAIMNRLPPIVVTMDFRAAYSDDRFRVSWLIRRKDAIEVSSQKMNSRTRSAANTTPSIDPMNRSSTI